MLPECNQCGKTGHIGRVCNSSKQPRRGRRDVEHVKKVLKVVCSDEEIEIGDTRTEYTCTSRTLSQAEKGYPRLYVLCVYKTYTCI